jgi:hypothetical protein
LKEFAHSGREAVEQRADGSPGFFDCSGVGFAQQGLHFGEGLLDRIEVWRVVGTYLAVATAKEVSRRS